MQALKANKLHHKGIIYHQTHVIGYKLFLFLRSTCRHEIRHNKNLLCETTEEKQENCEIHQFSTRKGNEIHVSPPQISNNSDHGHEAKLPIQISHLSAKSASSQKSLDIRVFCIIFTVLMTLYHEANS